MTMNVLSSFLTLLVLALSGESSDAFLRPAVSIAPKTADHLLYPRRLLAACSSATTAAKAGSKNQDGHG
jgi:hypothetical protein